MSLAESPSTIFRPDRALLIQSGVALATLALVLGPLVPILWQSLLDRPLYETEPILTLDNYIRLFGNPRFHDALVNSLQLAGLSTLIGVVLGVTFALFLERTDMPGRGLLRNLTLWPMYVSQLVTAFAWFILYGPSGYITLAVERMVGVPIWDMYTILGMGLLAGTAQAPVVYLFCSSTARMADATLEDAARSVGAGPLRVLWSVSLPLMRPAILYSALLTFIGSLEMLAVPLVFGKPVGLEFFTTFLYIEGLGALTPDYGLIGAAATLLLVVISVLLVLQGMLMRQSKRFVTVRGKVPRPKLAPIGKMGWVVFALMLLYVGLVLLLPLAGIVLRSVTSFLTPLMSPFDLLTLDHFQVLFGYEAYRRSIINSIIIATVGGALATLFVAMVALVAHRSEFRFRRMLEFVALYPRAMPGIIAGIGMFWAMLLLPFAHVLQGTIWLLMLAFTMRGIPMAFGALSPTLHQIGRELDQGARSVGADWWTTVRLIIFPLMKPALFSAYVLLFLSFLKEYAAAVFLFAPGAEIIGTTMLSFWTNGSTGPVAALSVIQLAITALFVTVARRSLRTNKDV
jgi:iron(III) transport system permease protein